jgi:hypothetical protein
VTRRALTSLANTPASCSASAHIFEQKVTGQAHLVDRLAARAAHRPQRKGLLRAQRARLLHVRQADFEDLLHLLRFVLRLFFVLTVKQLHKKN